MIFFDKLVYFLGATEHTVEYVKDYLKIILAFSCFPMLSYYMEVMVKVDGKPKLATICVCIAAICNIVLDYIFVIKLNFGVKGAAYATGISQMTSALVFFIHFLRKKSRLQFVKFKFDLSALKRSITVGVPDFLTEISTGVTIFMFNRQILTVIGESGVVIFTVISYLNSFIIMTMIAVSQGMQPLVSYNYGKGDKHAFAGYLKLAAQTVFVLSIISYFICTVFAKGLSNFFIQADEMALIDNSIKAIRLYSISFLFVGFNILLSGFYSAVEKPTYGTMVSVGRGFVVIAISLFIMSNIFGANGIWLAAAISEIVCLLINIIVFAKHFFNKLFVYDRINNRVKVIGD